MTIPESVSLIVQAGAMGGRGQVFVLDMGEPVSILELAKNMIRLSWKEPEKDIAIRVVCARAGEKIQEELWNDGETTHATSHPKILFASAEPVDPVWLEAELGELERLVEAGETLELVGKLTAMTRAPQRIQTGVELRTSTTI